MVLLHTKFDRLVQESCNCIANALELHVSCTKPSNCMSMGPLSAMEVESSVVARAIWILISLRNWNSSQIFGTYYSQILHHQYGNDYDWTLNMKEASAMNQFIGYHHDMALSPDVWMTIMSRVHFNMKLTVWIIIIYYTRPTLELR